MKLFGHGLDKILWDSDKSAFFFSELHIPWVKETNEDIREWKQLETGVIWGFILYSVCTVALFFRSVSWKRGAEPGSK